MQGEILYARGMALITPRVIGLSSHTMAEVADVFFDGCFAEYSWNVFNLEQLHDDWFRVADMNWTRVFVLPGSNLNAVKMELIMSGRETAYMKPINHLVRFRRLESLFDFMDAHGIEYSKEIKTQAMEGRYENS